MLREGFLPDPYVRMRSLRLIGGAVAAAFVTAGPALPAVDEGASRAAWPNGSAVVSYTSERSLERALARHPAAVVRRLPSLRVVEVRPEGDVGRYAARLAAEPGITGVERAAPRRSYVEPGLVPAAAGVPLQWQYAAVHADQVAPEIAQAADKLTIAVIDTGADLGAPDLAAKSPVTHSVRALGGRVSGDVTDLNGHGTFVAALAAGSGSNAEGVAGIAGEAQLMIVQAGGPTGAFTDVEEAAAIVYAVDHGARILNLSLGGPSTSTTERRAIDYAVSKGALLVAAVGNSYGSGNPVEYPAALLQPVGSRGVGGRGLAVAASTRTGARASFSSTGTHVSLAAPGEGVFSAVSGASRPPATHASRFPARPEVSTATAAARRSRRRRSPAPRLSSGLPTRNSGRRGRNDPGADRVRPGKLDRGARLRRARCRRGGRPGAGSGVHAAAPGTRDARRVSRCARCGRRSRTPRASASPSPGTASPSAC